MILRTLFILFFVLLAHSADAGPLAAALPLLGAIGSGAGFAAAVGGLFINTVLGLGFSLLMQAIAGKPDQPKPQGQVLELKMGEDQPMTFPIGSRAVAGRRKYIGTWGEADGTPNAYLTDVVEISNLPSYAGPQGIDSAWIDQNKIDILWDEPHDDGRGYPVKQYKDDDGTVYLWIKYLDGTQTEADQFLVSTFGHHPDRPYTADRIGRGCQAIILTARYSTDKFSGQPQGIYEPAPTPMYDLRKDSSIGGDGGHRWGDPSTYEPTLNPAIMIYNLIRGIYYAPDEWMYGGQNLAAHRLPADSWMAAANECDRDHLGAPQFRAGIEVSLDVEPLQMIENLRLACAGRLAEVGGMAKLLVGAAGAAVYAISDDAIVVTDEQTFDPFPSITDTHNLIRATYPEPKQRWEEKDAPEDRDLDAEAADGNRTLATDVKFDAVPFANQVQRLVRTMNKENRRFRSHTLPLPPSAWALEPNDVVSLTSVPSGYDNKKFLVTSVTGKSGMLQTADIRELDPTDYDPPDFDIPGPDGWIGPIAAPVQEMTGWTVEPATIADNANAPRRPAIRVSCAPGLDDVRQVWVQVRNKETGDVVFDSSSSPYAAPFAWLLSGNWCLPATHYEARGKYVPYSNRRTNFSAWLDVLTPDTRLSFVDLAADIVDALQKLVEWIQLDLPTSIADATQNILQETQDRIAAISQETQERVDGAFQLASRYRAIGDVIAQLTDRVNDVDFSQYKQKEELRQAISARVGDVVANFTDQITVATSATSALAIRVTTLEADTSDLNAKIIQVDTAQSLNYQALADRLIGITSGTDNQFDSFKVWSFDTSVEGWTGNGAPSVSNGYIRPANIAADPNIVSPDGLAVAGNKYRQIRARIRKTGNPTWEGAAWWMTSADTTWDAARRLIIAEPLYDLNGLAQLTWEVAWAGTVDQIRLDLSAAQTATDYFELDWVQIGAPSPGASTAALAAEQQARASGDAANAQQIVAMQSQLNGVNEDVEALSTTVDTLETNVTKLGDDVTAQGKALTSLQEDVGGLASADALAQLEAEVEALGGGGIVSQGQAITALRKKALLQDEANAQGAFAAFLRGMQGKEAVANASQTLTTRIEQSDSAIDILSQAVTMVQATLPGKADASALDALTSRVTVAEGLISSTSSALTALKNSVGDVSSTGFASLSSAVISQSGTIAAQGTAITSLKGSVAGKASVDALNALSTKVTTQGGLISAQAQSLTDVTATVDDITSDARLKLDVVTGPTGYARIGLFAASTWAGAAHQAGIYIDVPNSGGLGQVLVDAATFGVVSGGTKKSVFVVNSDGIFVDSAFIRSITTDQINFGDGTKLVSALPQHGIAQVYSDAEVGTVDVGNKYVSICSISADKASADSLTILASLQCQSGVAGWVLSVQLWENDNPVIDIPITFQTASATVVVPIQYASTLNGLRTYKLVVKEGNDQTDGRNIIIGRRSITAIRLNKAS